MIRFPLMNTHSIPSVSKLEINSELVFNKSYIIKRNICNLVTLSKSGVVLVVPAVENTMVSVVLSLIAHKNMTGRHDTISI